MDEREALSDDDLERWWRDAYSPDANIGAQARDRKIRRLIEELRRERKRRGERPDAQSVEGSR
jgi:hypothetical protein